MFFVLVWPMCRMKLGLSEDKAEKFVPAHPADLPVVQSSSRLLLPFCSICLCSSSLSPGDLSPSDGQERPVAPNKLPQGCLKRPKPFKPVCGRRSYFTRCIYILISGCWFNHVMLTRVLHGQCGPPTICREVNTSAKAKHDILYMISEPSGKDHGQCSDIHASIDKRRALSRFMRCDVAVSMS